MVCDIRSKNSAVVVVFCGKAIGIDIVNESTIILDPSGGCIWANLFGAS